MSSPGLERWWARSQPLALGQKLTSGPVKSLFGPISQIPFGPRSTPRVTPNPES
uniref:Uncharacterized protein n=1 Tax=Arundo donax TaxID=35708 RepID=A0A0A9TKS4_ARUDO